MAKIDSASGYTPICCEKKSFREDAHVRRIHELLNNQSLNPDALVTHNPCLALKTFLAYHNPSLGESFVKRYDEDITPFPVCRFGLNLNRRLNQSGEYVDRPITLREVANYVQSILDLPQEENSVLLYSQNNLESVFGKPNPSHSDHLEEEVESLDKYGVLDLSVTNLVPDNLKEQRV